MLHWYVFFRARLWSQPWMRWLLRAPRCNGSSCLSPRARNVCSGLKSLTLGFSKKQDFFLFFIFLCSGAWRVQQPLKGSTATSAHGHWVPNYVQPPSWDL